MVEKQTCLGQNMLYQGFQNIFKYKLTELEHNVKRWKYTNMQKSKLNFHIRRLLDKISWKPCKAQFAPNLWLYSKQHGATE